jgi:NADP-reducing hydrogenase subunit HndB
MKKLKIGDLEKIRDKVRRTAALRQGKARAKITIHMGTCGIAAGAREILSSLM